MQHALSQVLGLAFCRRNRRPAEPGLLTRPGVCVPGLDEGAGVSGCEQSGYALYGGDGFAPNLGPAYREAPLAHLAL